MKRLLGVGAILGLVVAAGLVVTGCDWGSSDDFNTSRGAGSNVNFSGTYRGRDGGALLANEGGEIAIASLLITQVGNSLEVRDNNNSYYTGRAGSPGVVSPGSTTNYPAGATMLQSQISFEGRNDRTRRDAQFVGTVRAVAVQEVTAVQRTITIDDAELQQTTTYTYQITEANTKYYLEGNWVEGGKVYNLNAEARANRGTF